MRSPPLKTGITWRIHPHLTPRPRCSPSRSLRQNVAPQKPRLSRMANPQHRKSLGVNDQRFPFLVHKRFHFRHFFVLFSISSRRCVCCYRHAFFRLVGLRTHFYLLRFSSTSVSTLSRIESNLFIVYNLHIFFSQLFLFDCYFLRCGEVDGTGMV